MKDREPLLAMNIMALRVVLILLLAIVAFLLWVSLADSALLLGLMLAGFFPVLVVVAILGAIAYVMLFLANARATSRKSADDCSNQVGHNWLVFGGITAIASLLSMIAWLVAAPFLNALWNSLGAGSSMLWLV